MIIRYFNMMRIAIMPNKTYSPLIVNPNAMLASAFSRQGLKFIAWWNSQSIQLKRSIKHPKLTERNALNTSWNLSRKFTIKKPLCFFTAK